MKGALLETRALRKGAPILIGDAVLRLLCGQASEQSQTARASPWLLDSSLYI
jgi:hypothetical protein